MRRCVVPEPIRAEDLVFQAAADRPARMVSWNAYQSMVAELAAQIRAQDMVLAALIGVFQGGWIVAQSLADFLPGVPVLAATARVAGGEQAVGLELFAAEDGLLTPARLPVGSPVLLVDEVVDSGRTARFYLQQLAAQGLEPQMACLQAAAEADPAPSFTARRTEALPSLVLPWRVLRDADQTVACLLAAGPLTTDELDERLRDLGHDIDPDLLQTRLEELAATGRIALSGTRWQRSHH